MNLSLMMAFKILLDTKMVNLYFESNKKNMSLLADDDVILKFNKIWKKIKKLLSVEFDSQPLYDEKYIKTRLKTFKVKAITKFTDNEILKENTYYSCIDAIWVNSVIKLEKENYSQVNLGSVKPG